MSLLGSLGEQLAGQATKAASSQVTSALSGLGSMGLPVSVSASSSASSGPSKSGDISGGTAFNIGGINLGTNYPSAATAQGGSGPAGTFASAALPDWLLPVSGVIVVGFALLLLFKRKRS